MIKIPNYSDKDFIIITDEEFKIKVFRKFKNFMISEIKGIYIDSKNQLIFLYKNEVYRFYIGKIKIGYRCFLDSFISNIHKNNPKKHIFFRTDNIGIIYPLLFLPSINSMYEFLFRQNNIKIFEIIAFILFILIVIYEFYYPKSIIVDTYNNDIKITHGFIIPLHKIYNKYKLIKSKQLDNCLVLKHHFLRYNLNLDFKKNDPYKLVLDDFINKLDNQKTVCSINK
ncbi:putative membrane protein [Clostridium bornimense]|uniref:Putative membrane protein n=1 Tax=Clostridium bornimense TaxID=1216932 RepID=W6RU64_9CLOT|nr:hypothetical protein [Clostridium bornimense]CDM68156.1 putative membrane protein [Clostridium bornimense]